MKYIAGTAASFFLLLPVAAQAESTIDLRISAHVDAFCHVYPPTNNYINVVAGSALIGQVKEVCNTPAGYDVSTGFSNISTGTLNVGSNSYQVDKGFALRSNFRPAVNMMIWSLADAKLLAADQPVVMTITITPR